MSQIVATKPAVAQDPPIRSGSELRRLRGLAVALALSWLVPVLANLVRLDWLLPILILVATASLIRGGRSLLDRLMFALAALAGAVCLAGLLFTVWPWGLSPVPVAGTAGTVLVAIAGLLRRRPQLPRPTVADGLTVFAAATVVGLLVRPYLGRSTGGRLDLAIAGEDLARHFTLFDTIRLIGGYAWLRPGASAATVSENMTYYPQGSHLCYALLDNFFRSTAAPGPGLRSFADMVGFTVAGYAVLVLAVLWAVQWIGGALVRTGARPLLVVVFITPVLIFTDLIRAFINGYSSEVYGLVLLVVLTALLARPLASRRTQIVLVGLLLVGIGFAYYLFLPGAVVATVLWVVARRRWLRGTPRWVMISGVVAVATSFVPIGIGVLFAGQAGALNAPSWVDTSRDFVIALCFAVAAGIAAGRGMRRLVWRSYAAAVAGVGAVYLALRGNDLLHHQGGGYYPEKTLVALEFMLLTGVGAVARLAPRPRRHPEIAAGAGLLARLRTQVAGALPIVLLSGALAAGFGLATGDTPFRPAVRPGVVNWGRTWWHGGISARPNGQVVARVLAEVPNPPGGLTVVMDDNRNSSYQATLFLGALERNSGPELTAWLYGAAPLLRADRDELEQFVVDNPHEGPVTVVATSAAGAAFMRGVIARHPELAIKLVDLSS